jgi:molybdopterin synthase catalytic subunit
MQPASRRRRSWGHFAFRRHHKVLFFRCWGHCVLSPAEHCCFTVRDNFEDKEVTRLEYEAYEDMALKEMEKLCVATRTQHPAITHVVVHHRLGIVPVGEASVIIAVSSPHRREAIEACHYTIDTLKATVPIWKKELYAEGEAAWKANKEAFQKV